MGLHDRPEERLLLLAARGDLPDPDQFREAASEVCDWPRVEHLAGWHGLTPLLYHHLQAFGADFAPPDTRERLAEDFRTNARRALVQVGELIAVLDVLKAKGIAAIPFKGPVAAALLYDQPSLRVSADLDLLIREEEAAAARGALESAGYRSPLNLTPEQDALYRRHAIGYSFVSPRQPVSIDLQWELVPRRFSFRLPVDRFRERLAPVRLQGSEVHTFSLADMLGVSCVHGSKHAWESLKWLVDVAELGRRHADLDYDVVMADSSRGEYRRAVLLGLRLASRTLGAPIPSKVLAQAESDSAVRWMSQRIDARMFDSAPSREGKARIEMRLEDSGLKQTRYVIRRLWTPSLEEWHAGNSGALDSITRPLRMIRFLAGRRKAKQYPAD